MENKKSTNILLTIMGVLIIVVLVARIVTFNYFTIAAVLQIITLVFVALYGFFLYKKPHGNMLKYAMLLFAFTNILVAVNYIVIHDSYFEIVRILSCAAVCYAAGRLNRIDKNRYFLPIIGIVFLGLSVFEIIYLKENNVFRSINCFNYSIIFITLMIAYFTRFKAHKEAGLADAPAKQ